MISHFCILSCAFIKINDEKLSIEATNNFLWNFKFKFDKTGSTNESSNNNYLLKIMIDNVLTY